VNPLKHLAGLWHMASCIGLRTALQSLAQRASGHDYMTVTLQGTAFRIPANASQFNYYRDAVANLKKLVEAVEGDEVRTIVDVGANLGHFSALALARWPNAKVFAFEPAPAMARQIEQALGSRVTLVREALCDTDGVIRDFFINDHSHATNSLLKENVERFNPDTRNVAVRTATLDGFCARCGLERIDVLKVDIQGAESAFLRGARRMIRNTGCALVEASFLDPDPVIVAQTLDAAFARRRVINLVLSGADIVYDRPRSL
jgi:FkbM family methyltransferase